MKKIEPMTHVPALEPGQMTVKWMLQSGQPVDSGRRYDGAPHVPSLIRDGIELSLEKGGLTITRTLDAAEAQVLLDCLEAHVRNITPNVARAPEHPSWPPREARRLRDNPQA